MSDSFIYVQFVTESVHEFGIAKLSEIAVKMENADLLTLIFSGIAALTGIVSVGLIARRWLTRKRDYKEYKELLGNPFEIYFLIPSKEKYNVKYAEQDENEHLVDELKVPPDTEDVIFLRIKPRISIELGERYFGFEVEGRGWKKPEIKYYNPFVIEQSIAPDYYIDWHGYYHLIRLPQEQSLWREGEVYVPSFKIKTYDEGNYTFQAIFHLSCNEYKSIKENKHKVITKRLKLIVQREGFRNVKERL